MKWIDIKGKKFGRLTAIEISKKTNRGEWWLCQCDCGNTTIVRKNHLTGGKILSCKCFQKERQLQGLSKVNGLCNTRIHRIWQNMKNRCYYEKLPEFKYWGGRGIEVCKEWKENFLSFYDWAIANGYKDNLSIDRIDVNGNYEPSNCRWATAYEQVHNRRENVL
jgi:hypothetical protein